MVFQSRNRDFAGCYLLLPQRTRPTETTFPQNSTLLRTRHVGLRSKKPCKLDYEIKLFSAASNENVQTVNCSRQFSVAKHHRFFESILQQINTSLVKILILTLGKYAWANFSRWAHGTGVRRPRITVGNGLLGNNLSESRRCIHLRVRISFTR